MIPRYDATANLACLICPMIAYYPLYTPMHVLNISRLVTQRPVSTTPLRAHQTEGTTLHIDVRAPRGRSEGRIECIPKRLASPPPPSFFCLATHCTAIRCSFFEVACVRTRLCFLDCAESLFFFLYITFSHKFFFSSPECFWENITKAKGVSESTSTYLPPL